MSINLTRDKSKIRPGRKSLRSESGSENALRRSQSNREETSDYELTPSPASSPHPLPSTTSTHSTSTESTRHIPLNIGDNELDDIDTPPMTPASARSQTKSTTSRELPKNWSDDESTDATEPESGKSGTCVCLCPFTFWAIFRFLYALFALNACMAFLLCSFLLHASPSMVQSHRNSSTWHPLLAHIY